MNGLNVVKNCPYIEKPEVVEKFGHLVFTECSRIPTCINSGGCGFFAYYASIYLTRLGIPHTIVACSVNNISDWEDRVAGFVNEVINNPDRDRDYYGLSCSHVMIKIGDIFLDSEGFYEANRDGSIKEGWLRPVGEYDLKTLKWSIRTTNGWNDRFDRSCVSNIQGAIARAARTIKEINTF